MRKILFLLIDRLRGAPLRRTLSEIEDTWSIIQQRQDIGGYRLERFHKLIAHACRTTPFYQSFNAKAALQDFPVVKKNQIRDQIDAFISSVFLHERLKIVSTSGSTGEPFQCYHDQYKVNRKLADILFFNRLAGYRVGMKHLLIRATPKSSLKQWMQNEVWVDPTRWDQALLERVVQHMKRRSMPVAIGYPSIMADVATYAQSHLADPSTLGLRTFIATSELFTLSQRDSIRETFGCRCVSRYATEEFGVLGQSDDECIRFRLNTSSFIIEILALDSDTPVSPGEVGRVVVTDLFSRGMPFIRYDTGDLAVLEGMSQDHLGAASLSSLEGKLVDKLTNTSGVRVSPLSILVALKEFDSIRKFQLIQLTRESYELKMSCCNSSCPAGVQEKLQEILGLDAELALTFGNDFKVLPSGKSPLIFSKVQQPPP